MTFPVTATSHTLADYRARGGYATLAKALAQMAPQDVTKEVTASGILGHGGAAFSGRPQVGGRQARRRPAALPVRQRRRGRAGHVQGPLDPRARAAPAARVDADRRRTRCRCATRSSTSAASSTCPTAASPARSRRRTRPATSASGSSAPTSPATSSSTAAPDRTSAARRRGCSSSLEGKRGYPRNRPPRLTVKGLYQLPTVVNNVETLSNVAGIIAHGAAAFKKVGTPKSPGTQLVSISGHIDRPGVYEVEYGYPLKKFLYEDCGGMLGGQEAQVHHPRRHLDQGADRRGDRAASPTTTRRSTPPARRWARAA